MIKSFVTLKRFAVCALLTGAALSQNALAACQQLTANELSEINNGTMLNVQGPATLLQQFNVLLPPIVEIDPDLAPGGSITSADTTMGVATVYANCMGGGTIDWTYVSAQKSAALPSDGTVYDTGVAGVGVRVTITSQAFPLPYPQAVASPADPTIGNYIRLGAAFKVRIELIKTGPIANGTTVVLPSIAQAQASGKQVVLISGTQTLVKVLPKCAVNASTLNIDFGTFGPREVSTTAGPTRPVNFSLTCTGPTPPTTITATLAATPDTTNPNLIANDATGAQNLGIQMKETASGTILIPNNTNSSIEHRPAGNMNDAFALEATVLRTGAATPSVGQIKATATITLSIL